MYITTSHYLWLGGGPTHLKKCTTPIVWGDPPTSKSVQHLVAPGTHPPQKVYNEGTVTYLPWERNATQRAQQQLRNAARAAMARQQRIARGRTREIASIQKIFYGSPTHHLPHRGRKPREMLVHQPNHPVSLPRRQQRVPTR